MMMTSYWKAVELGTNASPWRSYALVILRCGRPICAILDDGTPPPVHTVMQPNETAEHLVLRCPAHDQVRRELRPNLHYQSDPRRL